MKRLLPKAVWIFAGDGGAKLFGFIATIYLARTLGVEQFGQLAFALSVLGVCAWFTDMGINTVATRSIAASKNNSTISPADFLWLKVMLAVLTMLLSSVVIWMLFLNEPVMRALCLLFLLSLLPQALQIDWYYRGVQKFKWVTLGRWLQGGVYVAGLVLIVSSDDLLIVPLIYAISILTGAVGMMMAYRNFDELFRLPKLQNWPVIIKSGVKIGLGSFLAQSVILYPYIILGILYSDEIVGLYGAAFKIILVTMLADKVFATLLFPNLAEMWKNQVSTLARSLVILSKWMIIAGSAGSVILWFNSEFIIELLFGSEYTGAAVMLSLLSFFIPVTFLNTVFMFGLIASGNDNRFLSAAFYGGIVSILIMTAGALSGNMPLFLATVIGSELIISLFTYKQFTRLLKLNIAVPVTAIILALVLSVFISAFIPVAAAVQSLISLAMFTGFTLLSRSIRTDDIEWLKRQLTS